MKILTCLSSVHRLDRRARSKNTAKEIHIGCFFVGRNILLAAFVGIAFCFVFSCVEECHTKHSYENE